MRAGRGRGCCALSDWKFLAGWLLVFLATNVTTTGRSGPQPYCSFMSRDGRYADFAWSKNLSISRHGDQFGVMIVERHRDWRSYCPAAQLTMMGAPEQAGFNDLLVRARPLESQFHLGLFDNAQCNHERRALGTHPGLIVPFLV